MMGSEGVVNGRDTIFVRTKRMGLQKTFTVVMQF